MVKLEQKLYSVMSCEEQTEFLKKLTTFVKEQLPVMESRYAADAWDGECNAHFEQGMALLYAFDYTRSFFNQRMRFQDYRLMHSYFRNYLRKVDKEIAQGYVLGTGDDRYVRVAGLKVVRHRGRPTKEEKAAMEANQEPNLSAEQQKAMAIAEYFDLPVVTDQPQKEKSIKEMQAEKQARMEQEKAKMSNQLNLFNNEQNDDSDAANVQGSGLAGGQFANGEEVSGNDSGENNPGTPGGSQENLDESFTNSIAADKMEAGKLPLQQIKWLLSKELAAKVDEIREMRGAMAAASERAKAMAENGAKAEDVAVVAQEAHDINEDLATIYDNIDKELALVYFRLRNDETWRKNFICQHQIKQESVIKTWENNLKPYYNKATEDYRLYCQRVVDENNPEAVAKREQAAATKAEADKIIKYITRRDKPNTAKRLSTMEERYARLTELIGEDKANDYLPFLEKAREDVKGVKNEE